MKKILVTLALAIALSVCGFAYNQDSSELFNSDENTEQTKNGPGLPGHGETGDQPAPIGAGVLALTLFCSAYLIGKKTKVNK